MPPVNNLLLPLVNNLLLPLVNNLLLPLVNNLLIVLVLTLVFGCSSHQPDIPRTHIPPASDQSNEDLGQYLPKTLSEKRKTVVRHAIESVGAPYAWGGESPSEGFDCSGLVMYTHSMAGIPLPRTARTQFKKGRPVSALLPGDLVFFNAPEKKTGFHVGIFIGDNAFVHAPGKGRTVLRSTLENPYFKRYFKGARSFL